MRCNKCFSKYPPPDIIEGVAYFLCEKCCNFHEEKGYEILSEPERAALFQEKYGLKLPISFIEFKNTDLGWVVKTPKADTDTLRYYFGDGLYEFNTLYRFDEDDHDSIFHSIISGQEWGLPEKIVPIEGDGHTWLALDYRKNCLNPAVILIESDTSEYLTVAHDFDSFLAALIPYDTVYDQDSNVIINLDLNKI